MDTDISQIVHILLSAKDTCEHKKHSDKTKNSVFEPYVKARMKISAETMVEGS